MGIASVLGHELVEDHADDVRMRSASAVTEGAYGLEFDNTFVVLILAFMDSVRSDGPCFRTPSELLGIVQKIVEEFRLLQFG